MAYTTIDDPSAHFQIKTGVGASSPQSHTFDGNSDLQPDLLWWQRRDSSGYPTLHDSSRGANKFLYASETNSEGTDGNQITSFNTDGWSTGSSWFDLGSQTWVAWAWKANASSTSSNTSGTITSTVQANTDAGFSIVTYNGSNDSTQTIGHGLGQRPDVVMVKRRSDTGSFIVWTSSLTSGAFLQLAATNAEFVQSRIYQAGMTTTTFGVGFNNTTSASGHTYVAYCFAEKQGYSKFGKYTGNANANGPFVYTGFRPAFVLLKNRDAAESWVLYDTTRNPYNVADLKLSPDTADAENGNSGIGGAAYNNIDILSNGFKCRTNNAATNGSGNTIIYMAFAENPFVTSTGVPTTAR